MMTMTARMRGGSCSLLLEAGAPVNVTLTSVVVSNGKTKNNPITTQDVTGNASTEVAGLGLFDVTIDLPRSARNAKIFVFQVEHDEGFDNDLQRPIVHSGSIMQRTSGRDRD